MVGLRCRPRDRVPLARRYAFHEDGTIGAERWVENQLLKLLAGASGGGSPRAFER